MLNNAIIALIVVEGSGKGNDSDKDNIENEDNENGEEESELHTREAITKENSDVGFYEE